MKHMLLKRLHARLGKLRPLQFQEHRVRETDECVEEERTRRKHKESLAG